jgi:DNA polymerase I
MVRLDRVLREKKLDAILLLQIHDELILEIDRSRVDTIARAVKHEMEHAVALSVPLEVNVKTGMSWYDIQNFDMVDILQAGEVA